MMRTVMSAILGVILLAIGALYFFAVPDKPIVWRDNGSDLTPPPKTPAETPPKPDVPKSGPPQPQPPRPGRASQMADWSEIEQQVFALSNQERVHAGVSPFQPEDGLRESARFHSSDMIRRNFFDHVNPSHEDPSDRIGRIHRRLIGTVGENIWTGSGKALVNDPEIAHVIVRSWMESPHHRENILRPEFTHLGVGIVVEGNNIRATQNFARVRAYLQDALPERLALGSAVRLDVDSAPPNPEMFDLFAKSIRGKDPKPAPLSGSRLTAPAGTYRLRLYFPSASGGFQIVQGPQVRID